MTTPPLVAWVICFQPFDPGRPPRLLRWMRRGFQHCFAVREAAPGLTLVVNQVGSGLQVSLAEQDVATMVRVLAAPGDRWFLLDVRPEPPLGAFLRGPMTCVETVKSLLGIRAWWIVTPWQLYRRLRADGAKVLFPIPT